MPGVRGQRKIFSGKGDDYNERNSEIHYPQDVSAFWIRNSPHDIFPNGQVD